MQQIGCLDHFAEGKITQLVERPSAEGAWLPEAFSVRSLPSRYHSRCVVTSHGKTRLHTVMLVCYRRINHHFLLKCRSEAFGRTLDRLFLRYSQLFV